jgi:hypothetical protein
MSMKLRGSPYQKCGCGGLSFSEPAIAGNCPLYGVIRHKQAAIDLDKNPKTFPKYMKLAARLLASAYA